ncbi:MAG: AAA family ATPase [Thermoplasmata archaeon]
MLATPHPEVLALDWLPPVILGREAEVAEVVRRLDAPDPHAPPPWMVGVVGPRGAGTSSVARRAAREVADRLRVSHPGVIPRWVALRTPRYRATHGVAAALLASMDEGFDGRGFPVAEIVAGFLRRLRREGRPLVLVLDDVRVGGPDLGPLLRALGDPDRFLPEGESGIPRVWTVLAGTPEGVRRAESELHARWRIGPFVTVAPYGGHSLRSLVDDRTSRALGRSAPPELVERIVERTVEDGGGAIRALDLVRRALLGPLARRPGELGRPRGGELALPIESRVIRAIEEAARGRTASVGDVKRLEARYARAQGVSPLPPTTLWRRIVRLEQAGYVRREVRPGGVGGTRSVVKMIAPIDEWVIAPRFRETHRAYEPWVASGRTDAAAPFGELRPLLGPPPSGGEAD